MSDIKISALTAASTILPTDLLPLVSGGITVKATPTQIVSSVLNSATPGTINNTSIGSTTASTGKFTTLESTSITNTSSIARNAGLTSVTSVAGSSTLATGGITLASQIAATGSVWRVKAYGTYAAASSANARTLTMSCYWGTTQLTAITTGNVLASTAQTTAWSVEFEINTSSTTAAWTTGVLSSQVTSATIPLNNVTTASSVTVTAGAQTLDFRVGQTGTVTSADIINVHQVIIERLK
ncbi:hypothetical protein UFOVP84_19 [uncultured Caudovirales phage]|uniref:Uncharacterized protein n=1 Tax=uncultured Caudovirales phage TaxID=2100421 RepID=A0A6J5L0H5_9CAUD|nr:hypothetical protein UFOVP84_19 [uncultured Caudovirales phage]